MKTGKLFRTVLLGFFVFYFGITSIISQTPQNAAECAQEMIVHHVGNVAPAHVGCALNVATYLRELHQFPNAVELRNGVTTAFTSCYGALPNANVLVNKLISNLNEINDVNATTFGGSSCLEEMWAQIDAVLAEANASAGNTPPIRTNTTVANNASNDLFDNYTNEPGGSSGDPHIVTLDGFRYGFQAEGIFTALVTTNNEFEIQVIQKKLPNIQASQNEAIAIKYGKTVINLAVSTESVFVNGKPLTQKFPATLSGGMQILQPQPKQFIIKTPKGDVIAVRFRRTLLDYFVKLSPRNIGAIKGGVLGNYDFNNKNELIARNGMVLQNNDSRKKEMLYQVFGNSWRIEPKESLFVEEIKLNYPSFDNQFPVKVLDLKDLPAAAKKRAQLICQTQGVEDKELLDNCIHDLSLTNNREFAESALFSQTIKRNPKTIFASIVPNSGADFRGKYTFDYTFTEGVKTNTSEFEVVVSDGKAAARYKKEGIGNFRLITDYNAKTVISIIRMAETRVPTRGRKIPFNREMIREKGIEKTRTSQTKNILGYICTKYLYKSERMTGEIWVAESLKQPQYIPLGPLIGLVSGTSFNFIATFPEFASLNEEGLVLEANLKQQNQSVNYKVKSLSSATDETIFDISGIKISER